jgi:hypothetical protein
MLAWLLGILAAFAVGIGVYWQRKTPKKEEDIKPEQDVSEELDKEKLLDQIKDKAKEMKDNLQKNKKDVKLNQPRDLTGENMNKSVPTETVKSNGLSVKKPILQPKATIHAPREPIGKKVVTPADGEVPAVAVAKPNVIPGRPAPDLTEVVVEPMKAHESTDITKQPPISKKEAIKTLDKIREKILMGTEVRRADEFIDKRLVSITSIDLKTRGRADRGKHNAIIGECLKNKWSQELGKMYDFVSDLIERIEAGEDTRVVLNERPVAPEFQKFLRENERLIVVTSEKYDYYVKYVRSIGDEIVAMSEGELDHRVTDVFETYAKIEEKIKNPNQTVKDFMVFIEGDIEKLEKAKRDIIQTKKEVGAYKTKKTLEAYKKVLLSDKSTTGKGVEQYISEKVEKLISEGVVYKSNEDGLRRYLGAEYEKRKLETLTTTDKLIDLLEDKNNNEYVISKMPTFDLDKWIDSPEVRANLTRVNKRLSEVNKLVSYLSETAKSRFLILKYREIQDAIKLGKEEMSKQLFNMEMSDKDFSKYVSDIYSKVELFIVKDRDNQQKTEREEPTPVNNESKVQEESKKKIITSSR